MSAPCPDDDGLRMHPHYHEVLLRARESHERFRSPEAIESRHVQLARLYCYAFRLHTIGAFHAVRQSLGERPTTSVASSAFRLRAVESLSDLGNQSMEAIPLDFRAVVSTFYRYHLGIVRVVNSLERESRESRDEGLAALAARFRALMEEITGECGIHLTQDQSAPKLASFLVPNLGITIVPLVYGDHHSWNLAFLEGDHRDVPTHRHHHGVEIHLGYNPTHGLTVLGNARANVDEGYAMPIPPETDHGWVNTSDEAHHVPFIFGSLKHGGWGVFLDVEASSTPVGSLRLVERETHGFSQMVYLEREIQQMAKMAATFRKTLIPASVTNRRGSGGLELSVTRVNAAGYHWPSESFRIVSVARGRGRVSIEGAERELACHDHFGIPAGMRAQLVQQGSEPLVVLDALIKGLV